MENFAIAACISLVLIVASVAMFREVLAYVWVHLPRLEAYPRLQIPFTVVAAFVGHTVCVWLFGATYYVLDRYLHFGSLKGDIDHALIDYVYFSAVSYSSLGLGDVYPVGGLQMLVGVEAILGLILIGWTITFTFVVTEKYLAHRREHHKLRRK